MDGVDYRLTRKGGATRAIGWALVAVAASAAMVRMVRTASTLPASAIEPALVDSAYGRASGLGTPNVDGSLAVTDLHLRMYTTVTSAFSRHGGVLTAARELSVAAAALLIAGLVVAAVVLRVRPLIIAVVVGMLAASGPVITLLVPVGPGGIAAGWLAVAVAATAAAIGRRDFRWIGAGVAALLIVLSTAPVTIIPIGVASAAWFAFSWGHRVRLVLTAAILAVTAVTVWLGGFPPAPAGLLGDEARILLIALIGAAAAGGLVVRRLRPVAAGIGAGAGFAAVVGPRAEVLLPALVLAAVLLVAVLFEDAANAAIWQQPAVLRRACAGLAGVAAVVAAAAGLFRPPPAEAQPDHAGLANWVNTQVGKGVTLVAPPGLWSELGRDLSRVGLPPGTVRLAGATQKPDELLVAMAEDHPPGTRIAEFDGIAVMFTGSDAGYQVSASRVIAGRQLAENSHLIASDEVLEALRAG